jgi:hypothetical protein
MPPDQRLDVSCAAGSVLDGNTNYQTLVKRFGAANVKKADIDVGEGETAPGALVFPDDPERRLEVIWGGPKEVSFTIRDKSLWQSTAAIALGTTLKQLERINGKAFTLAGFEWDYSGTVTSWNGGQLQPKNQACRFLVRLGPDENSSSSPEQQKLMAQVSGDRNYSSAHPAMQQLNPRAYEIIVTWRPASH